MIPLRVALLALILTFVVAQDPPYESADENENDFWSNIKSLTDELMDDDEEPPTVSISNGGKGKGNNGMFGGKGNMWAGKGGMSGGKGNMRNVRPTYGGQGNRQGGNMGGRNNGGFNNMRGGHVTQTGRGKQDKKTSWMKNKGHGQGSKGRQQKWSGKPDNKGFGKHGNKWSGQNGNKWSGQNGNKWSGQNGNKWSAQNGNKWSGQNGNKWSGQNGNKWSGQNGNKWSGHHGNKWSGHHGNKWSGHHGNFTKTDFMNKTCQYLYTMMSAWKNVSGFDQFTHRLENMAALNTSEKWALAKEFNRWRKEKWETLDSKTKTAITNMIGSHGKKWKNHMRDYHCSRKNDSGSTWWGNLVDNGKRMWEVIKTEEDDVQSMQREALAAIVHLARKADLLCDSATDPAAGDQDTVCLCRKRSSGPITDTVQGGDSAQYPDETETVDYEAAQEEIGLSEEDYEEVEDLTEDGDDDEFDDYNVY